MITCLITDRGRLAPGAREVAAQRCLLHQVQFAVDAAVDLIQVRERDLGAGALVDLVRRIVEHAHGSRTRIIVNERVDVALAAGADGVHLRRDSLPVEAARRLGPAGFIVGRSIGAMEQALAARDADYLIAGTVWPSESKTAERGLLGIEGFARIAAAAAVPVLAIGGVTVERAVEVARVGGQGIAAIGMFMSDSRMEKCRAIALHDRLVRLRASFDTLSSGS
jgi:thiamine-phosphate diphosphorylase